uniref:Uncharacterized protein n=1 Tax=Glossina austeni TaxID=7395 RepID=A0A1A9UM58_GLOAU
MCNSFNKEEGKAMHVKQRRHKLKTLPYLFKLQLKKNFHFTYATNLHNNVIENSSAETWKGLNADTDDGEDLSGSVREAVTALSTKTTTGERRAEKKPGAAPPTRISANNLKDGWHLSSEGSSSDHQHIRFEILAGGGSCQTYRDPKRTNWIRENKM